MDLATVLIGSGGSVLGFVGAMVTGRSTREAAFNRRLDTELAGLREEVALCREERTQFAIVKMGVLLLVPELKKRDPDNPVLVAVAAAYAQLPPEREDFAELLRKLHEDKPDEPDA